MRVRMGTSNTANNPVNNWTESTGAVNWNNVRAVEVSLLVRAGTITCSMERNRYVSRAGQIVMVAPTSRHPITGCTGFITSP